MFTCEQRDPQPGVNVSAETLETIDARLSFHREMHERKREERRRREETKERRRDWREGRTVTGRGTSASYQVPIPSRHHGGITVPGCPIGFNRNRLSRAAEFRRETTASPQPSIYERPLSVRPWVPIDPMDPLASSIAFPPLLSPSRHNFAVVRILRTSSDKGDSDSLTSSTTRFCEHHWNYARGITLEMVRPNEMLASRRI